MRVLHITNMYPAPEKPWAGVFIKEQIESLIRAGVECEVLVIGGRALGGGFRGYVSAFFAMRKILRRKHFDVVHAHHGMSAIVALSRRRTPLVVSFTGSDVNGSPSAKGVLRLLFAIMPVVCRVVGRLASAVIVKSAEMKRRIGLKCAVVIPNGVDYNLFRPMPQGEARKVLGLPPDRRLVLFAADPSRIEKRYHLARATVEMLPGELNAELLIEHRSPHDRMPLFLNAADAVLLTSTEEGSPNIVKEAMACNRPVVSTDVGDVREIIGGTNGCSVCEPTPEALARGLEAALTFGGPTDGREQISHLEMGRVAERVVAVYRSALAEDA